MVIKIALAVLFVILFTYIAFWYKDTTEEAVTSAGTYIKKGVRATKHSREMVKDSKEIMKEREKMGEFEDQ
jgi:F0F1-type ATP synthase membrane subunit b/b'